MPPANAPLSRRDLFSLRNLLAPLVAASAGVTTATRFASAMDAAFPESKSPETPSPAPAIPVRCPW